MATALCAWAAWPEKNESYSYVSSEHHVASCEQPNSATGDRVIIYKDDCKKCKIYQANHNQPQNICGKCTHHMKDSYDGKTDNQYAYYTYTCKNCGHECYVKVKL